MVCEKRFAKKKAMDIHVSTVHLGERKWLCRSVIFSFYVAISGYVMLLIYFAPIRFSASASMVVRFSPSSLCDRRFLQRRDMKRHIRSHHLGERYPCDICGKEYTRKNNLKIHVRYEFLSCSIAESFTQLFLSAQERAQGPGEGRTQQQHQLNDREKKGWNHIPRYE